MTSTADVFHQTLPNGLDVILRESHDAPVASFWVWYRVGSRNELPGLTGVSHWVEHMQFKGTPTYGKGAIFGEISRNGGVNNAMTSNDWTAYYETLPADRIDLAIRIESDRMVNSLFDPSETESERTVILSERQGAENNPNYVLYEEVVGTAFRSHPYRHMVIGYESDLRRITRDELYTHYRRAYQPANAFVVAAGDFDAGQLLAQIEHAFGSLPPGEPLPAVQATEPPQLGERRITLRRPSPTSYLRAAYHAPAGNHRDTLPLIVADAILSGAKPMGMGGGSPMNRSSRLYKALVASGLARSAGSDFDFYLDPYVLVIGVTAIPGTDPDRIESILDAEIDRLAAEPVDPDELVRAVKQVKAQYVYASESVTNQAVWLGQMHVIGDYRRALTLAAEIERVTAADILRVAQTYLRRDQRTLGWLHPGGQTGGGASHPVEPRAAWRRWGIAGPGAPERQVRFDRAVLPSGIVVLGQPQPADGAVSVRMRFAGGSATDPVDRHGVAAFTARVLRRGTEQSGSAAAFNEQIDRRGATLALEAGRQATELTIRSLAEDLPDLLALAADAVRRPLLLEDEIEKVRKEIETQIVEQENDTSASADRLLREALYPEGHPLRHRVLGSVESIAGLDRTSLLGSHARTFGPKTLTIAAVGGYPSFARLLETIETQFGDWPSSAARQSDPPPPPALSATTRSGVEIPGKSQADLVIGSTSPSRSDPDFYAFEMANLILGRLGLMGRLGANVRDKQGLAYYAYSAIEPGRNASIWTSRAGVDPSNIERAIDGIREELRRIRETGVTAQELADGKAYSTGVLPLALETNDGIATMLLAIEYFDLGLDYIERYPAMINALTADEVRHAIRSHLDPDRLAIAVARPAAS